MVAEGAVLATGRIFGLDSQLLFDLLFQGIAVFILFLFVGYLLINPVRNALAKRQEKVQKDREDARRKAVRNENDIIDEAKAEAGRIRASAEREAALEKEKVKEEVRVEIIGVASAMAGKMVAANMSPEKQEELLQETLDEIGDETWQSK